MAQFDKIVQEILEIAPYLDFPNLLTLARKKIGFKLYRVSLDSQIPIGRLKRLENGLFKRMPEDSEIRNLSEIYGLDFYSLKNLALKYIESMQKPNLAEQVRGKIQEMHTMQNSKRYRRKFLHR